MIVGIILLGCLLVGVTIYNCYRHYKNGLREPEIDNNLRTTFD